MIKVSFKLDISFSKLMFGVIGLTATVGAVRYFSEKMNKNSDEKLQATPANKFREKSTSDHEKLFAPKPKNSRMNFSTIFLALKNMRVS